MQLEGEDTVQFLANMAGVDYETAGRVLRKYNNNTDRAVEALLDGDTGIIEIPTLRQNTPEAGYYDGVPPIQVTPAPSGSQMDLLNSSNPYQTIPASHFTASTRAPDPNWAMVPSNLAVTTSNSNSTPAISHDEQTLKDAIAASLSDFSASESKDAFPDMQNVREGGRPVAIRADLPTHACGALVVQALYHIPQVRAAVGQLRLPDLNPDAPYNHHARAVVNLIELFCNLDMAQLATIVDVAALPSFEDGDSKDRLSHSERATILLNSIAQILEAHLAAQKEDDNTSNPLFQFTHVNVELNSRLPRKVGRAQKGDVVKVEYDGSAGENDLISRLNSLLSTYYEDGRSFHDVIIEPSQTIAFELLRHPTPNRKTDAPTPFAYPKHFYLDRYIFHNLELVNRKHAEELEYGLEIQDLTHKRDTLTKNNGRDAIQDLKDSIRYLEEHADTPPDDPTRKKHIKQTAASLRDVLTMVESKVEGIDRRLKELEAISANVYNVPELQKYRYDLRAVLMHTGLPGRKQIYSYVQDADSTWWKTCDHEVTEVTEDAVLRDATGLHLNAGPFMLLYSMHIPNEEIRRPISWPKTFVDAVEKNNEAFMKLLPPELASKAKKRRSLPVPRSGTPSRANYLSPPRSGSMGPRPANPTPGRASPSLSKLAPDSTMLID